MTERADLYDAWLAGSGPAALVIREHLMPVEGRDGVLFPATFAPGEGFAGGYNIDEFSDGTNVCLVDSVGSQANRIEPIFAKGDYAALVPQVKISAGEKTVDLLDAGHRAGDAIARCSELQKELQDAFRSVLNGDAEPLAKIAPTSLVFGAWDSRDTQAKLPRLIASTIRAFNVRRLTRSAQFIPAVDYVGQGLLSDPGDVRDADGNPVNVSGKHSYAKRGFVHVPATAAPGGVIATGGVRRDATLHLAALRLLSAGDNDKTLKLRRYVLGLALAAFTYSPAGYLRQGCNLVLDPDKPREFVEVYGDGRRVPCSITHLGAVEYATVAAKDFSVGPDQKVKFDTVLATADVTSEAKPKKARGKKAQQ